MEAKAEEERLKKEAEERERKERKDLVDGYKAKYPAVRRMEELNVLIPKKEKELADKVAIAERTTGSLGFWIWGLGQGGLGVAVLDFAPEVGIMNLIIGIVVLLIAMCFNSKRKAKAAVRDARWELNELRREQKQLEKELPSFQTYLESLKKE